MNIYDVGTYNQDSSKTAENGRYMMTGTNFDSVITIDDISCGIEDFTIEIFGPAE